MLLNLMFLLKSTGVQVTTGLKHIEVVKVGGKNGS